MAGKMKNCSNCGKVFVSINNARICMDCREKEEQWEKAIVEFVRENPKSQIGEIVEATGVQEPVSTGVDLFYPCEKCGSPIQKGQYCDKCQKEMREELTAHIAQKSASGMRTTGDKTTGRKGYVTLG